MKKESSDLPDWAAGFSSDARPVIAGLFREPSNRPLDEREVLRIDGEQDTVVLQLTGFKNGVEMRQEFLRLRLDVSLAHMSHHERVHNSGVYVEQLQELRRSNLGDPRAVERVELEHHQNLNDRLWAGQPLPAHRASRIPDINVFGLVLCVVFGGLSFGVVRVLPYFNLSSQHVGLLFHNAVRIVGPALAQDWAPPFRSSEWLLDWCSGGKDIVANSDSDSELSSVESEQEEESRVEALDRELRAVILGHDLVLFADGVDRKSQKSLNMGDQSAEYGIKKKTLQFHGLRWVVVTNRCGDIVFRTSAAGHSFAELDLLMQSGFFVKLDACFGDRGKDKVRLALVCDRGYFDFDAGALNKTMKHIVVDMYHPALKNRPYGARDKVWRSHVTGAEAAESTTVASLRAFNEIGNLHFAQNRIYQHVIPIALFYLMDFIDDVAFSMANLRANCPRANARRK
jgi:hypothetical protein